MYRLCIQHTDNRIEKTAETRKTRKAAVVLCDYWNRDAEQQSANHTYFLEFEKG